MEVMKKDHAKLKRPWTLTVLALSFAIAPVVNLIIALYLGGHPLWYSPTTWIKLFFKYSAFEQFAFVAGIAVSVLLFRQSKRSWGLAFTLVILITGYNFLFSSASQSQSFQMLSVFNISATLSLIGILYFFRYPYLDKRDSIVGGTAPRYPCHIGIKVNTSQSAIVKNISKSGCFFECADPNVYQKGQKIQIEFQANTSVTAEVIHTRQGVGVKFLFQNKSEMAIVENYIKSNLVTAKK